MSSSTSYADVIPRALSYLSDSPTQFHNCSNMVKLLGDGFSELSEKEKWEGTLKPGGLHFFTRNSSTLVAFAIGGAYDPLQPGGFEVIVGHSDSPNLRIKPCSGGKASAPGGVKQLNVECYGGGLWHTWFDRDLSLAGRVVVKESDGRYVQRLVDVKKPVCRVPSLCIHLQNQEERAAFKVNKENHLQPIFAQAVKETLGAKVSDGDGDGDGSSAWQASQEPLLLQIVASSLGIKVEQIADFELSLYDVQPASLGGANDEFLYSARLDNEATCFTAVDSLKRFSLSSSFSSSPDVAMICLFDHEEIGSATLCGAGSPILGESVRRITEALSGGSTTEENFQIVLRKSFVFSVDMAHAIHPNYASKHDKNHAPSLNGGMVIKSNANQRYTTSSVTGFIVREIGRRVGATVQEFVVRNDCPCGSTTGPIISQRTGMRCVDLGMSQLSMHSCRETMGSKDLEQCIILFEGFFKLFRELDDHCFFESSCIRCP